MTTKEMEKADSEKCENCGEPATHSGEFSEGNESGGRVPICFKCARTLKCHGVRPLARQLFQKQL